MDLSGYRLETLRQGPDLTLVRAHPSEDAPPLLALLPLVRAPAPATSARLEHELSLASSLDPAFAVQPLRLGRHKGRPALLLTDPGGHLLSTRLDGALSLRQALTIAISLAAALRQLHARGLVHRDLTPAHVLVGPGEAVRLTGFGRASHQPRERQAPGPREEIIAGTLAYLAPEQTGRMNRSIDARADLYALGIILYQMLTGELPFAAANALEWIHCHVAREPAPPSTKRPELPMTLDAIILKLLAKEAEERYQTALGLELDLRRTLEAWQEHGRIDPFELGTHDHPDRLLLPARLYDREAESDRLTAAFGRVACTGAGEWVLVVGAAGVGKSALVQKLHRDLAGAGALFATGKFDQYKLGIPYATLAQAFGGLIRQLLGLSEVELTRWREALRAALGRNGQLMVELLPELALIIGEQPPMAGPPQQEHDNRFHFVFHRFVDVFARPEHPLVLVLDDLQWLDPASLQWLERLAADPQMHHLLLVGTYRDSDVGPDHSLTRLLERIRQTGQVSEISLSGLRPRSLQHLLADALHMPLQEVEPLAELVFQKTAGNPFSVAQFLTMLVEVHLLVFDSDARHWWWNLERIAAKGITDNVADLVAARLTRLPSPSREAMQHLAGLGISAPAALSARVLGWPEDEVHQALQEVVRTGLLVRQDNLYTFAHDRVQEAAYALVPEHERAALHLRIGRGILSGTPTEEREGMIFEIVNQLNRGSTLITGQAEREEVAHLNWVAAARALASTAYAAALGYCMAGQQLLGQKGWVTQPQLALELELTRAECEFLTGSPLTAEERLLKLAERTDDVVRLARVVGLLLWLYRFTSRDDQAIIIGLAYLRRIGIDWVAHPADLEVEREYQQLLSTTAGRPIETFVDLPLMSDPIHQATMEVLARLLSSAHCTDANLHALIIGRAANLSLEHGNSDWSIFSYGSLPLILAPQFGRFREGLQFGQLAYDLVEKRGLTRFKARAYAIYGALVTPWTRPLRNTIDVQQRAFAAALEAGDPMHASFARNYKLTALLVSGAPLEQVQKEAEDALQFSQRDGFGYLADITMVQLRLILTLRGLTSTFGSFNGDGFDEDAFEYNLLRHPALSQRPYRYWIRKLQTCFLAGDIAAALQAADRAWATLSKMNRHYVEAPDYHLYGALALAAHCSSSPSDARKDMLQAIAAHHRQLAFWAQQCPQNFADRAALIGAEVAQLEGREFEALRLYDEAIRLAEKQGFIHNEALAHELAARFCLAHGLLQLSDTYLHNARACYARWGANGKVRQLEQLYPQLGAEPTESRPDSSLGLPMALLDLATAVKVSQAISGEIDLTSLLNTLMRLVLEHSGATRALLLLPEQDAMQIQALAMANGTGLEVQVRPSEVSPDQLPLSVLRYVTRTRQSLVLADAADEENAYASDEYIRVTRPRALLFLPLLKQAELTGVLYLENRLASNVFGATRLPLLELIAGQAAVALENARLYAQAEHARQTARQNATEFKLAFDMIPALAWQTSPAGKIEALNQRFLDYTGIPAEDAASERWLNAFHPDDAGHVFGIWQECLNSGKIGQAEGRMRRHDGVYRSFLIRTAPMRNEQGAIIRWFGTNTDIEDLKRAERLVAEEKRLLEMIATARPVPEVLEALCRAVEDLAEGTYASILLLDPVAKCLRHGAAPSLPESYTQTVDGSLIGPRAGSCGTAAYLGKTVFVPDIATDPLWADYPDLRDRALACELRACWSSPIWSSAGTVLGTFALYGRQARPITPDEEWLVEQFTHIASIVIERGRMDASLRASLAEKEALLKEVHHRVKNNLQLISSLLSLQAGKTGEPSVAEQFAESRNRVRAMALVHENLYRASSFARINMAGHVRALCAQLVRAYRLQGQTVELTTAVDEVEFDLERAVAVGLIINELVSNALKHAFPNGRSGQVEVRLEPREEGRCCLSVADDGVGLPAGLTVEQADTMGLQLACMLTEQLHGTIEVTRGNGTTFAIWFNAET